jgi:hypothetical protein
VERLPTEKAQAVDAYLLTLPVDEAVRFVRQNVLGAVPS